MAHLGGSCGVEGVPGIVLGPSWGGVAPGHSLGGVLDRLGRVLDRLGRVWIVLGASGILRVLLNFTEIYPPSPQGKLSTLLID